MLYLVSGLYPVRIFQALLYTQSVFYMQSTVHVLYWPIFHEINPTLKNMLYFLVELKSLFLWSFQGSWMQFQGQRLVTLWTDVCVTADMAR